MTFYQQNTKNYQRKASLRHKKATPCLENAIYLEAKQIAKGIKLDDKIVCAAENLAFITL